MTSKKNDAGGSEAISIPISRLHLDLNNPRHEPVASESEAIAKLCDGELIAELASDIAERGSLSPLEVIGVIPMDGNPGHFVSVEGNRRTCALIVASDPARAPVGLRAKLSAIAKSGKFPSVVKVHVFKSRQEARPWIELRHLGLQGGAGTKNWDPTQKNRAASENRKSSARDNALSVLVLDRLLKLGKITQAERDRVSVTTLTRYLGTPAVRAILGLGSARDLIFTHDPDEVDKSLLRLVMDSIYPSKDGTVKVHSRSDSTERQQYANQLKQAGDAPETVLDKPIRAPTPKKNPLGEGGSQLVSKGLGRSSNHPGTRKGLVPTDFRIQLKDDVLLRLRKEALNIDCEEFSFSANYLLRALIEQVLTLYAKDRGVWAERMPDHLLTQKCAGALELEGVTGKAILVLKKAGSDQHCSYSLHSLGAAAHGGVVPAGRDLKKHFETWRPALDEILERLLARQLKKR